VYAQRVYPVAAGKNLVTGLSLIALSGCSQILDWSPEGLPCDAENKCGDGFSCLGKRCVADGSLAIRASCNSSVQCEGYPTNICGSQPYSACRKRCLDNYLASVAGICNTGEYCRPEPERERPTQWTGTCVESECSTTAQCRNHNGASDVCVAVSPSANACWQTCTVSVSAGVYSDTCGTTDGLDYCQPIGPKDNQSLVCLSRLDNDLSGLPNPGDDCAPVRKPCRPGAACVGDAGAVCRIYCDVTVNVDGINRYCPSAGLNPPQYCCQVTNNGNPIYAVCMPEGC
jgi:hypothetical protein